MTRSDQLSRRHLLGLVGAGAAGVLTGGLVTWRLNQPGSAGGQPAAPTTSTTVPTEPAVTTPPDATDTTDTTDPPPLQTERYVPVADEVFIEAKLAGVRAVEELMTYVAADEPSAVVDRALRGGAVAGLRPEAVLGAAEALFVAGMASTVEVVYPQLGGLDPHRDPRAASIMVVVLQRLSSASGVERVSRCVDVRVRKIDDEWLLDEVADTSGRPVNRPTSLGDEALRVLEHGDIAMPDSVRWDIFEGIVDRRILTEMADLADQTPIAVTTCMRGHPINVFGTPNRSAHSVGRAVDIWAVGNRPVVQQRDDRSSVAYQVTEAIFGARRVHRLGAPWAFDGAGGRSWTDPVHLDHLHLGVSA